MLKFVGVANILFFVVSLRYLVARNRWWDIRKHTASDLARSATTGVYFNLVLLLFSIGQVIFALAVYRSIHSYVSSMVVPLFIIGGAFLCITSLFSTHKFPLVHGLSAMLCALFVGPGVALMGIGILRIHFSIGVFLVGVTCLIPATYAARHRLSGGLFEIPIFVVVFLWNILFSVVVFTL